MSTLYFPALLLPFVSLFVSHALGTATARATSNPYTQTTDCRNDRSGLRFASKCNVTSNAVGDKYGYRNVSMRKVFIAKPAGDTGEETAKLYYGNQLDKEFTIGPGFEQHLYLSKRSFADVRIEVITNRLGAGGQSTYYIHCEWVR